jgi:cell filamentation protein
LGHAAGHPLDLSRVTREAFLPAMIQSYHGNLEPLSRQIQKLRI